MNMFISYEIQIYSTIILEIYLICATIKIYNPTKNPILNGVWVHLFNLLSTTQKIIQYKVLQEKSYIDLERIFLHGLYKHDLRNYIYSLILYNKKLKKLYLEISNSIAKKTNIKINLPNETNECKHKTSQGKEKDNPPSFNNHGVINSKIDEIESVELVYNKTSYDKKANELDQIPQGHSSELIKQILEYNVLDDTIDNHFYTNLGLGDMSDQEYEQCNIVMNYKMSFLFHLDDSFDQRYNIKVDQANVSTLFKKMVYYARSLLSNKINNIQIKYTSYLSHIYVDQIIFYYFINYLILTVEENNHNFIISINFKNNNDIVYLDIKLELINNEFNKYLYFNPTYIIYKLIENLNKDVKYSFYSSSSKDEYYISVYWYQITPKIEFDQKDSNLITDYDSNQLIHDSIYIYYQSKIIHVESKDTPSKPNNVIPISEVVDANLRLSNIDEYESNSVLVCEKIFYKEHNGYIYVNLYGAENKNSSKIISVMFSTHNIHVLNLNNITDFTNLLPQIYMDNRIKINQKYSYMPKIVVFVEHELNAIHGYDAIKASQRIQYQFDLEIMWYLLHNNQDKKIIEKYNILGIEDVVIKPLTNIKLSDILSKIFSKNYFNAISNYSFY